MRRRVKRNADTVAEAQGVYAGSPHKTRRRPALVIGMCSIAAVAASAATAASTDVSRAFRRVRGRVPADRSSVRRAPKRCRRRPSLPDQSAKRGDLLAQLFRRDEILRHVMPLEEIIRLESRHAQRKSKLVMRDRPLAVELHKRLPSPRHRGLSHPAGVAARRRPEGRT